VNFVQTEFLWLMTTVYVLYWVRPTRLWQNTVLIVSSCVFYGWVHEWWLILLFASSVLDFSMGQLMVRSARYKKLWLAISLSGNIGMLLYFKYCNFFIENTIFALQSIGVTTNLSTLNIILPAGISFYTFQTMSYTLDIYRGELKPRTNFLDYCVFISFFPQLVAGPVERAARLLPQVEVARKWSVADLRWGFGLAIYGAFKKMVIADTIAPYVDKVYLLNEPSGPMIWAATFGFVVQIYADFSGYTDIARGCARMLGIDLMKNFDEPYMAATTPEFWQRWHMSLSSWIRDYLLAPLLGDVDEVTGSRFIIAVTITMVIMGAWHGAGWNYILFGIFHSVGILFYIVAQRRMPDWVRDIPYGRPMAVIFHMSFFGGIGGMMFREPSTARLISHLTTNPFVATADEWRVVAGIAGIVGVLASPLVIEHWSRRTIIPWLEDSDWKLPAETTMWGVMVVLMFVFHRVSAYDFIYFQF
jgi:D-alanyl-lipoteichoic acid acyltransferase DltB (MBOAT superfamily)